MTISNKGHVVLMLTARLGENSTGSTSPLSIGQWSRFTAWLEHKGIELDALLKGDPKSLLSDWCDREVSKSRVLELLNRGAAVGFALEHWERAGLWMVFKGEENYPSLLEERLQEKCPPVLFGCGSRRILHGGGIAVVGSRDAKEEEIMFTEKIGVSAAENGFSVISGGARGVDEAAMLSALSHEGTAVGILADSLYKAALSKKYGEYLRSGNLTLISTVNPETGFTPKIAMSRNKYIYCLSNSAIVVCCTHNKGGTWTGAMENLKEGWTPLWTKPSASPESGYRGLIGNGASELPSDLGDLSFLASTTGSSDVRDIEPVLTKKVDNLTEEPYVTKQHAKNRVGTKGTGTKISRTQTNEEEFEVAQSQILTPSNKIYQQFLMCLAEITSKKPMSSKDVATELDIKIGQAQAWLKKGVDDGYIKKQKSPVKYQYTQPLLEC